MYMPTLKKTQQKFIARGGVTMEPITIISILLGLIVGAVVGYFIRKSIAEGKKSIKKVTKKKKSTH